MTYVDSSFTHRMHGAGVDVITDQSRASRDITRDMPRARFDIVRVYSLDIVKIKPVGNIPFTAIFRSMCSITFNAARRRCVWLVKLPASPAGGMCFPK